MASNQRLARPCLAVDHDVVRRVILNDRPEFSSDVFDFFVTADDSGTFRDVTNLQEFLASKNVDPVRVVSINIEQRILSRVFVPVVEVRELRRVISHRYQIPRNLAT
ncbi:hypothetical protein C498_09941 [Haloferax volcanii DS2]|uniref:Uncharacterized protein n=1 Tax=Haloferax volcanii (strain ATCC 29605 / DSM 3757 / JCM 8879 / NBRC 14742 / NCIMB 2012 / VKM B-1768 / DS2) TaxID=309800 RepID=L9V5V1_HALVD|nr:hypothetical protein C498_09941 [Haloferax volcanii DS2]